MDELDNLRRPYERIRWARFQAGFERAKDAADSLGVKPGTYRTYERSEENDGRIPPPEIARKLARKFKVSWVWLLTGEGDPKGDPDAQPRIREVVARIENLPDEKREDALNAVEAVILSFTKRAS